MAHEKITMLDVIRRSNTDDLVGIIDESALAYPEWAMAFARSIKGINYRTLVRTALPEGAFRAANEGVEVKKATYINRLVECFIMDAGWNCDKAVADAAEDGAAAECTLRSADRMKGAIQSVCKQFYYGASSGVTGASKGFQGLADFVDSSMVVDAAGTGSAASSVYAVKFGIQDVAFVVGNDGAFQEGELHEQQMTDDSGNYYTAYVQSLMGWIGLQVGSKFSVGRIKNITTASGKTLTDDMLGSMLDLFPVGQDPDMILMTRRSVGQLRDSRTATNATGAPAPRPTEYEGIPIVRTDAILNTETAA